LIDSIAYGLICFFSMNEFNFSSIFFLASKDNLYKNYPLAELK